MNGRGQGSEDTKPRVVVVGSGFGGYFAARRLQRGNLDLSVLSSGDCMLYQPLLPDVAVGALDPRSVVVPLATTLRSARLIRGRATVVDLAARTVSYTDHMGADGHLSYD